MDNILNYKKRFFNLLESEMGNVKPLISEATGPKPPTDYREIKKFQTWMDQNITDFDLGNSGPNKDGVDGVMGGKTAQAWSKYGQRYLDSTAGKTPDNRGEKLVDITKSTINRMLDSGEFDYDFIENRISPDEAADLLNKILNKESDEIFHNLPEAVIEAIFIRMKNAGCGFFTAFIRSLDTGLYKSNVLNLKGSAKFKLNYDTLMKGIENKLPMDINKKYHKESIASILSYLKQNCSFFYT